jgi:methyl-accepting chemotaxis protein
MMGIGTAQAQVVDQAPLLPDLSPWQAIFGDPVFLVFNLVTIAIVVTLVWTVRRRYARFYGIQREALDHRKEADAQTLARGQSTEEMIARQYDMTNAHNERVLAHSQSTEQLIARQYETVNAFNREIAARAEEALRLSNETLAQINTVNQSLARIANRLDSMAAPPA